MEQPGGSRFELVAGEIVAMAPERAAHSRLKGAIYAQLAEAIRRTGLTCEAYPDGMAVEVDARNRSTNPMRWSVAERPCRTTP